METGESIVIPKYGMGDFGVPGYEDKKVSGLPESYSVVMHNIVAEEVKKNGGIFLDVGGGTGELAKNIESETGIKALSMDYSSVGMIENRNFGVMADAKKIPILDHVAGVVHTKDVIEHLNNEDLASFALEVKRVLVDGGKFVVTEKDYYTNFPFFDKPSIQVSVGDKKFSEKILDGEIYSQTVNRLREKYVKEVDVSIGLPRIPRSKSQIVQQMKELGFTCINSSKWRSNKNEPDWFNSRFPRNIMTFSLDNNLGEVSEKLSKQKKLVLDRFEDPRNSNRLEDLVGGSDNGEEQKLRKIDWVPRKMDISRITDVIKLVVEQRVGENPLKIVDIGGLNGFLGRLILDDLDQKSSGNVVIDVVDPNKLVIDYAQKYYKDKEPRLKFIPEKAEKYAKHTSSVDVVICSWMRPEMNLRPAIEELKPKVIIFIKDILGDVGQPQSFVENDNYKKYAAWLGFSGHDIEHLGGNSLDEDGFISNVVLIMSKDNLLGIKIRKTLSNKLIDQFEEKYPWENELPVTNKGLKIHDTDDFDSWVQTEDD